MLLQSHGRIRLAPRPSSAVSNILGHFLVDVGHILYPVHVRTTTFPDSLRINTINQGVMWVLHSKVRPLELQWKRFHWYSLCLFVV